MLIIKVKNLVRRQVIIVSLHRVRVIHGKGTGTMKGAVADYLSKHPLVKRHYAASPAEGNGGVTIAELM